MRVCVQKAEGEVVVIVFDIEKPGHDRTFGNLAFLFARRAAHRHASSIRPEHERSSRGSAQPAFEASAVFGGEIESGDDDGDVPPRGVGLQCRDEFKPVHGVISKPRGYRRHPVNWTEVW
jgi:hypothetical protein